MSENKRTTLPREQGANYNFEKEYASRIENIRRQIRELEKPGKDELKRLKREYYENNTNKEEYR